MILQSQQKSLKNDNEILEARNAELEIELQLQEIKNQQMLEAIQRKDQEATWRYCDARQSPLQEMAAERAEETGYGPDDERDLQENQARGDGKQFDVSEQPPRWLLSHC